MFSKKATKINEIFTVNMTVTTYCQIGSEDFVNFCGLLRKCELYLGNIHVLRKQKGGREGVSQMLTIAYGGGGGLWDHAYVIIFWIFFCTR